jgi:class 3 adenylate cyclase
MKTNKKTSAVNNDAFISINSEDIQSIDHYRKSRNTAVLTIMFTDIKGYTSLTERRGDEYAQKLPM